jgi:hypothetical protein
LPGFKKGQQLCRYHWHCWAFGKNWANKIKQDDLEQEMQRKNPDP